MASIRHLVLICAVSAFTLSSALAQTKPAAAPPPFKPESGQAGKDVVWVPTPQALVDRMLEMGEVKKTDYLVDLGSGDGRTVITAAKRGTRAHGIEYNPDMVGLAQYHAKLEGVEKTATFEQADIFQTDFSKATVVTMFLLPSLNIKLRPTILDMKPGTRVISNSFDMGDWKPDTTVTATDNCDNWCTAHKWIVPAKVAGAWTLGDRQLKLTQTYQVLDGTLVLTGGQEVPITDAKMNGAEITFSAEGKRYTGRVDGDAITGNIAGGGSWKASRMKRG